MPYNGSGTYSPPGANFPAVAGATITAANFNAIINDLASALSSVLVADGQKATTGALSLGAPLKALAGTALAPSITFGTDTDTGFFLKAAGKIGVAIGGVEVFEINAAGIESSRFSATSASTLSSDKFTTYGSTYYNVGSDFNATTGVYTVPADGIYSFAVSVYFERSSSAVDHVFAISTNGARPTLGYVEAKTVLAGALNIATGPVYLTAGTEVYVTVDSTTNLTTQIANEFNGAKLG